MQDKIFKVKNFKVTHKSVKSVKVFSLEVFRLYGRNKLRIMGRNFGGIPERITGKIKHNGFRLTRSEIKNYVCMNILVDHTISFMYTCMHTIDAMHVCT